MAQTGYIPIILFHSTTASATPTTGNLAVGELGLNSTDGKLYYNTGSAIAVLAGAGGAGIAGGSNTQVQYNSSGSLAGSANLTFNGTTLTANTLNLTNALGVANGGTGLTSLTAGYIPYGNGTSAFSSASTFNYNATSGLGVNGLTLGYNTNLYATDGTLSNYSSANNVYLNGNAAAGLSLSGDGSLSTRINIYATSANYMAFFTASAERMRITSAGNVGIGTNNPQANLEASTSSSTYIKATNTNGTAGNAGFIMANTSKTYYTIVDALNNYQIYDGSAGVQRLTIDTSGNVNIKTSNAGITFANSSAIGSSTLNDYETGTWTPVIATDGTQPTGATYSFQAGAYTKVGKMVHVEFIMVCSSKGTGANGTLLVSGLPFVHANNGVYATSTGTVCNTSTAVTSPFLQINPNVNYLVAISGNGATATGILWSNAGNNIDIRCTMSYEASF